MFKFDDTLEKLVNANLDCGKVPFLAGEPGIGKSSWVEDLARKRHAGLFTLAVNQLADKADLLGPRMICTGRKDTQGEDIYMQKFFPHSAVSQAVQYALDHPHQESLLFMDEINRCTPDITSTALSLPTLRQLGDTKLPDNLSIIVAGNDKGNVTPLDKASLSRFVIYPVGPDMDTFLTVNPELNVHIAACLRDHPEALFMNRIDDSPAEEELDMFDDAEDMSQITTPRTITALSDTMNRLDDKDLLTLLNTSATDISGKRIEDMSMLQEMVEAHVGHTAFALWLCDTIAKSVTIVSNRKNVISVPCPAGFKEHQEIIAKAATIAEIENYLMGLDPIELSANIAYALYDTSDNTMMLQIGASILDHLEAADTRNLMEAAMHKRLSKANVDVLLHVKSAMVEKISTILQINQ